MSTVFVHVGQAGNQIGCDLWNSLNDNAQFFDPQTGKARGVLIDTEPKVIQKVIEKTKITNTSKRMFEETKDAICTQNGRGNNWALGYSQTYLENHKQSCFSQPDSPDDRLYVKALDLIRQKAEKADFFRGVFLFHSLAGGTGSGLGSRLVEAYKDEFGSGGSLMTASVWPAIAGETPLQQYNTCLSLARIQEHADASILFQNDHIIKTLESYVQKNLRKAGNVLAKKDPLAASISMGEINEYIASVVKGVLVGQSDSHFDLFDIMNHCVSMPNLKMLHAGTNPFTFRGQ